MVIIIKPTYACNFRCKYCYLSNGTKTSNRTMDVEFAKKVFRQIKVCMAKSQSRKLTIIWHGGEPLLWGIENYRQILAYVRNELKGYNLKNCIQTNLSVIDKEYIELFKEYDVHVGFSFDGPKEINDSQRVDANGNGTYNTIVSKIKLCKENSISLGCIVVGSKRHMGHIQELYQCMCEHQLNFKFNPLFEAGEAQNNEDYGITSNEYAQMAIELFDLWYDDNLNQVNESNFQEIASALVTGKVSGCMFGKNCQENFIAISPDGEVFPCGRFCDESMNKYSYGNLHMESLEEILFRIKKSEIYKRAEYIERSSCKMCKFYNVCHGGCLHDGFLKSGDFTSKTFLCLAYKQIFAHIEEKMKILMANCN